MYIRTYIQNNDCWGNNHNAFRCLSFCTLKKKNLEEKSNRLSAGFLIGRRKVTESKMGKWKRK